MILTPPRNSKMRPLIFSGIAPLKSQSSDAMILKRKMFADAIQSTSRTIGPMAIVGGTATIYTAALSHSSSTLTPVSVLYLLLLALNYSIMPRISKKYIPPKVNKKSVALVEEVVKLSMGIGGFLLTDNVESLKHWTINSSLLAAGLPSTLYAIQGVLTYKAYQNLDSVTFNGLTQMKTFSAALCCYLVLGKVQSRMQMLALALLSISTVVFQGGASISSFRRVVRNFRHIISNQSDKPKLSHENSVESPQKEKANVDMRRVFFMGIAPCLAATFLSGLAGAFSQRSLQLVVGSMERGAYWYSAEISFFSAVVLLFSMAFDRLRAPAVSSTVTESEGSVESRGRSYFFKHWTWQTLIPIFVKACCGILTALVHKHSGSVMKGFSLVLGLVFSALLQTALDKEDLTSSQFVGTALVLLSSWLHFTSPP